MTVFSKCVILKDRIDNGGKSPPHERKDGGLHMLQNENEAVYAALESELIKLRQQLKDREKRSLYSSRSRKLKRPVQAKPRLKKV